VSYDAALPSYAGLVARLRATKQQGSDVDGAPLRWLPAEAISAAACGNSWPSPHCAVSGYRRRSSCPRNLWDDLRATEDAGATSIHQRNGSIQTDADDVIYGARPTRNTGMHDVKRNVENLQLACVDCKILGR
jgi:hypothetical protein